MRISVRGVWSRCRHVFLEAWIDSPRTMLFQGEGGTPTLHVPVGTWPSPPVGMGASPRVLPGAVMSECTFSFRSPANLPYLSSRL